jgi:hypothetical protein
VRSRPRPYTPKTKEVQHTSWPAIKTIAKAYIDGCYVLEVLEVDRDNTWPAKEANRLPGPLITDEDLFSSLKDGGVLGEQVRGLEGKKIHDL